MNRIAALNARYSAVRSLDRNGVEIVVVGDAPGARVNAAVGQLQMAARNDGVEIWGDLIGAMKVLRWRRISQPQPVSLNQSLQEGTKQVVREASRLRGAVADDLLLSEVQNAATAVAESNSPVGTLLLRSIREVGSRNCVVIVANKPTQIAIEGWLAEEGAAVFTPGELSRQQPTVDVAYVIGPPRLYNSSLVTAPVTSEVNFYIPDWFTDRSVPQSAIAQHAEGAIKVCARIHVEGTATELDSDKADIDNEFLPEPEWGTRQSGDREPGSEEVEAHKLLLSGNYAVWLDDGDRIRVLDTTQPGGERVAYIPVDAVRTGTYLLLRLGETEHGALYQEALALLGPQGEVAEGMQRSWKNRLSGRLLELGYPEVVAQLKAKGVRTAERSQAWTDPNLIRPLSDYDFRHLLEWLGIPPGDTFENATRLRKMVYQISAEIRKGLEAAVSEADLLELERFGHLSLQIETERVRGILATRVLAISPFTEIKIRSETRVPFKDEAGRWLE